MILLRPYQEEIIAETRRLMSAGHRSILVGSPTGSGKTLLTAFMLKAAKEKGVASLFIVHRRELVKQSAKAFDKIGLSFGIVSNGFADDYNERIQICSIQTLSRRVHKLRHQPTLIIWDECHHTVAKNWSKMRQNFQSAFHVGLTATPARLDGKGLSEHFKMMVHGPSVSSLIKQGYLADYRYFAPPNTLNRGSLHTRMGDYVQSEVLEQIDNQKVIGDAVKEYQQRASGKRAVVFCVNIEHSKHVCAQFNLAGIPAEHIDGESEIEYREAALARFESGKTSVLCNVDLFGEGFDLPTIECAILLRPTKSLSLYLQQVGRSLRPSPGKSHAIIIDHVNNCMDHGLPDDIREWSLNGLTKRDSTPGVKICTSCFAASPTGSVICSVCGQAFPLKKREQGAAFEFTSDSLSEIDKTQFAKKKFDVERQHARSKDDLLKLAISRGYKHPHGWVHQIMQARQRKKLGQT